MSKAVRTILSILVALVLFSTLTMAQAAANTDKNKNDKQHHSKLSKAKFWSHHKASEKTKPVQASKSAPAKTAQLKPVSAKASAGKNDMNQQPRASNTSKPSPKKAPAATKAKAQPKPQDGQTALLKQ